MFEIVLCRLRYKLSLRNLAETFLLRGWEFTHEAVREWEERFAPLLVEKLRRKRMFEKLRDRIRQTENECQTARMQPI